MEKYIKFAIKHLKYLTISRIIVFKLSLNKMQSVTVITSINQTRPNYKKRTFINTHTYICMYVAIT